MLRSTLLATICAALSVFAAEAADSLHPSGAPQAQIGFTTLIGSRDGLGQEFFGGIPYAESPIGPLRMKPPVAKKHLQGRTFDASRFGSACLQPVLGTDPLPLNFTEDCLTVNVLRPAGVKPGQKLPIMAWVHGGSFSSGTASLYNGTYIVARSVERKTPIIFVNLNYRVGPIGFPVGQEAQQRGALNLGLKDQLAALKWIQDHIEAFGGDKRKVTVFGESAGSISIATLFINSGLEKLARAAIMQSGAAGAPFSFNATARPDRTELWNIFVKNIPQCAQYAGTNQAIPCLQRLPHSAEMDRVMENAVKLSVQANPEISGFAPTIDGPGGVMPDFPSRLLPRGHFAKIPFIAGTVLDEGTLFVPQTIEYTPELMKSMYIGNVTPSELPPAQLEKVIDGFLKVYPDVPALGSPFGSGNDTLGLPHGFKRACAAIGDSVMVALRRSWIRTASSFGVRTWGYLFTDASILPTYGVNHGSDVRYVFGGLTGLTPGNINLSWPKNVTAAAQLGTTMMDYWISFATSLDPNDGKGTKRPYWGSYASSHQGLLQLDSQGSKMIPDDFRKEAIGYILDHPVAFRH